MKMTLLTRFIVVGALFSLGASANAQDWSHRGYHDQLEHRDYHRGLEHREAHRYPQTWRQHDRLHDALGHDAYHDRLEHRSYHRSRSGYAPIPRYGQRYSAHRGGFGWPGFWFSWSL